MLFSNLYLGIYAIAWVVLSLFYFYKVKGIGFGGMLLIIYSISAITSIFFYNGIDSFLAEGNDIEWQPLLYLFVCLNICMLPIYKHSKQLGTLRFKESPFIDSVVLVFMQLVSLFIIEAFIEIFLIALRTNSASLGSIYEAEEDTVGNQLSFLGRKTMAVCRWFTYIWPIIFFMFISKSKKYKKYAFIALLAYSTSIIEAYCAAARVGIVRCLMYFFLIFMLFKNTLPQKMRQYFIKFYVIILPLFFISLILITLSRFNNGGANQSYDVWTWVFLYTGEAPIRFCQYLWDCSVTMDGDNSFGLLKELLGLNPITDLEARRTYWEPKLGIPNRIFYTWLGDIFFDVGRIGTVIYSIVFCLVLEKMITRQIKRGFLNMSSVLCISLFLLSMMFGIMYMPFKTYQTQLLMIPNFLFLFFLHYCYKKKA